MNLVLQSCENMIERSIEKIHLYPSGVLDTLESMCLFILYIFNTIITVHTI